MQKAMSFNNIAVVYVKGNTYRIHFWYIKMMLLTKWMILFYLIKELFYKNFFIINFFVIYKNEWEYWFNLLSKNRDAVLSKAKDYYKNNKERLREQARHKYRNLSEEEKN